MEWTFKLLHQSLFKLDISKIFKYLSIGIQFSNSCEERIEELIHYFWIWKQKIIKLLGITTHDYKTIKILALNLFYIINMVRFILWYLIIIDKYNIMLTEINAMVKVI